LNNILKLNFMIFTCSLNIPATFMTSQALISGPYKFFNGDNILENSIIQNSSEKQSQRQTWVHLSVIYPWANYFIFLRLIRKKRTGMAPFL
jgi:hypothetical protein